MNEKVTVYIDTLKVRFSMKQLKYFQDLYAYCRDVIYLNLFIHCCMGILEKQEMLSKIENTNQKLN